ncbi:MAG: hypothetical protein F6K44_20980 [Moorea sp. SIO3E2]|nr:hypothetical protein [Moorena sp. SIO3E2]
MLYQLLAIHVGIVIIIDALFPIPYSRLPTPDSRLPTPDSRLPTPDSLCYHY